MKIMSMKIHLDIHVILNYCKSLFCKHRTKKETDKTKYKTFQCLSKRHNQL